MSFHRTAGLIALDQLAPVRIGVARVLVGLRRRALEVFPGGDRPGFEGPVQATGVVQAHLQPFGANRGGQIADQVALRRNRRARPLGIRHPARPQAEAVVMLAGEHHIARAGLVEQPGPFGRFPLLHFFVEHRREIVVVEIRAVGFDVMLVGRRVFQAAANSDTTRRRRSHRTIGSDRPCPVRPRAAPRPARNRGPNE